MKFTIVSFVGAVIIALTASSSALPTPDPKCLPNCATAQQQCMAGIPLTSESPDKL
jgi:hypothetical protein